MAKNITFPDTLHSANPQAMGIVVATEVAGHKSVATHDDLYKIPDAILSASKTNKNNDAIGQIWYVLDEDKRYALYDWNFRHYGIEGWRPYYVPQYPVLQVNNKIPGPFDDGKIELTGEDIPATGSDNTSIYKMVLELMNPVRLEEIVDNPTIQPGNVPDQSVDKYGLAFDKSRGIMLAKWYDGPQSSSGNPYYFQSAYDDPRIGSAPRLGAIYIIYGESRVFVGVKDGLCELTKTDFYNPTSDEVFIGTTEPKDPRAVIWIDPSNDVKNK